MPWDKPYNPAANQPLDRSIYSQPHRVVFFTLCAYNRTPAFVTESLNKTILSVLREEAELSGCAIYTYCLMPDHLHFLIAPLETGCSALLFCARFKGKSTNRSWMCGWHGKLWQPRQYDHVVRKEEDLLAIANYILGNPVRKGLVEQPQDWQWSGNMSPLPL